MNRHTKPRTRPFTIAPVTWPAALLVLMVSAHTAAAEPSWFISGEAPAAIPISNPQRDWFRPGALPALSVYRNLGGGLLAGARFRAGMLRNGPPPGDGLVDYGTGGLTSLSVAVRAATRVGGWVDMAAGVGVTGELIRPTFEVGAGWSVHFGKLSVSPMVRYLYVHEQSDHMGARAAQLVLGGVELAFSTGGGRRAPLPRLSDVEPVRVAPVRLVADVDRLRDVDESCANEYTRGRFLRACPNDDWDYDGIVNDRDQCPWRPETINGIEDQDGCPDKGEFVLVHDRIVLDARVLFKLNRSRVRSKGRSALRAIARWWKQHPEWTGMVIDGHSCRLGPEDWNQRLSEDRARRVRRYLMKLGIPGSKMRARGFGSSRPVSPDAPLQLDRRVELEMIREHKELRAVRLDQAGGKR